MPGIDTLAQLQSLFSAQGVRTAYVKHLSPKQDNDNNQIYLDGGLDGVINLFPARIEVRSASTSLTKRKPSAGKPKLEAQVDFAWLGVQTRRAKYFFGSHHRGRRVSAASLSCSP